MLNELVIIVPRTVTPLAKLLLKLPSVSVMKDLKVPTEDPALVSYYSAFLLLFHLSLFSLQFF